MRFALAFAALRVPPYIYKQKELDHGFHLVST